MNITYYTTIDDTPIYRTAHAYFTAKQIRNSGGGKVLSYHYVGSKRIELFRYFIRNKMWGIRFFSRECLYIFDCWLRLSAFYNLNKERANNESEQI